MWRPSVWAKARTEFFEAHQRKNRWGKARQIDYEAGADAMLEAIWKMAKESPTGTFTFDTNTVNILEGR